MPERALFILFDFFGFQFQNLNAFKFLNLENKNERNIALD